MTVAQYINSFVVLCSQPSRLRPPALRTSLWELSDVNPSKLHLTVPNHFRRNSKPPRILVLHHADVPERDIEPCGPQQPHRAAEVLQCGVQAYIEDSFAEVEGFFAQVLRPGGTR